MNKNNIANDENSVALLYKSAEVADKYIDKRFTFSWSKLLHKRQVAEVNQVISKYRPEEILEVAPGPARIATDLKGVSKGLMIDISEKMLRLAEGRLKLSGCYDVWDLRQGNAYNLSEFKCQFDFLYTFRFVRHFKIEERTRLYNNFYSCLKPGGFFMLDVVNRTIREKIEAKYINTKGDLPVHDVTYLKKEFYEEIIPHGFEVLSMKPVSNHYILQSNISYLLSNHISELSYIIVNLLEKIPSMHPLEWIVLCRKK